MTLEEQIRAIVRDELEKFERERQANAAATSEFYSQHDSPLGKRRFLEAARAGAFPSSKRGKLVLAKRADVDAWIAAAERDVKPANDSRRPADRIESIIRRIGGQRG